MAQASCCREQPRRSAVDGKTAKQGIGSDGNPIHMLNALVHYVQAVVGQWSTGDDKTNEPSLFRRKLRGLLESYPMLQLITGDAIFAQRPLIRMIRKLEKDYLFQIKGNQGDTLDALENCFAKATERAPAAQTDEKGGSAGTTSSMAGFRQRRLHPRNAQTA